MNQILEDDDDDKIRLHEFFAKMLEMCLNLLIERHTILTG